MIRIIAKTEGFRRCGVAHSTKPTDHPDDRFSNEQLAMLCKDPELTVTIVEDGSGQQTGNGPIAPGLNANDTIALVLAATSLAVLDQLAEGESRKGVLTVLAKKRAELQASLPAAESTESTQSTEPAGSN